MEELTGLLSAVQLKENKEKKKSNSVVIVHEPMMQIHSPANSATFFELPRRIVAIESVLRGHPFDSHVAACGVVQVESVHEIKELMWGKSSPVKNGKSEARRERELMGKTRKIVARMEENHIFLSVL